MKRFRRMVSFLLALTLLAGMMPPVNVSASETEPVQTETTTETAAETTLPTEEPVETVAETGETSVPAETETVPETTAETAAPTETEGRRP